jgi:hypothetical protein
MRTRAAEAAWQPEVLHGALRRRHRRRIAHRGLASAACAGVVALVAAVALSAAGRAPLPGGNDAGGAAGRARAVTVAFVVSRARSAVAAETGVLEIKTVGPHGWSFVTWSELGPVRQIRIDVERGGDRISDTFANSSRSLTVNFRTRTWREAQQEGEAPVPVSAVGGFGQALPTPQNVRRELASGAFRLVGATTSGGVRLLRLQGTASTDSDLTVWINAASYLPVRSLVRLRSATSARSVLLTSELSWLTGRRANLQVFIPVIPAGFRHQAS